MVETLNGRVAAVTTREPESVTTEPAILTAEIFVAVTLVAAMLFGNDNVTTPDTVATDI